MSLSKSRLWIAGTVVLCLALSAGAWFLLIAPTRAEAAELRTQRTDAMTSNDQLESRIKVLQAEFATLDQKEAELAKVREAMPQDPELAELNRKLEAAALGAKVTLMRVTPSSPVAAVAAAPAPTTTEGTTDSTTTTAAPAVSPLVSIPVSIEVVGSFANASVFIEGIQERLGRDYLIEGLNIVAEKPAAASGAKPAVANGDVTMTISGRVFVLAATATTSPTVTDATGAGTTDS